MQEKAANVTVARVSEPDNADFQYSFLIRPQKGFTSRLLRRTLKSAVPTQSPSLSHKLLFEGPYGHAPSLDRFERILVIIGGSGISVGISSIYEALEQRRKTDGSRRLDMHLVWTCRRRAMIESVMNRELKSAAASGLLAIDAFVTQEPVKKEEVEGTPELYGCRSINDHRPAVADIIHEAAVEKSGGLAVVVCGPSTLTDDTRAAVVQELLDGAHDLSLFVEAFTW